MSTSNGKLYINGELIGGATSVQMPTLKKGDQPLSSLNTSNINLHTSGTMSMRTDSREVKKDL